MKRLKSNSGAVLAYVLIVLIVFLTWLDNHLRYTYDYIKSNEYILSIEEKLEFEREVIRYINDSEMSCPVDFDLVSFTCDSTSIVVRLDGLIWFTYEIKSDGNI